MSADPTAAAGEPQHRRLKMLDGWRAISILAVMAAHMLPLGPARWAMNGPIAANGMAIFFTLSGFLIVSILLRDDDILSFLVRRFARILPLAWAVLAISFLVKGQPASVWIANFLFYANLPPFWLDSWSSHYWSLCLEMQFYVAIALVVATFGRRGLMLVPVAALIVTGARIITGTDISIVTWFRVDEILAGGILALILHGSFGPRAAGWLGRVPFWPVVILFLLATRPELPWLNYIRPYLAATMVGITVVRPIWGLSPALESRPANYIAQISYALYIVHHFTLFGWLGAGHGWEKYAKRPICFAITFALAHWSTFHFENRFIDWSHRVAKARRARSIGHAAT
ncbi:acyltransferase family protein [Sphingomonas sp. TX0543]|uniref:acyltransferase family protein n=1 Tax=unclassified Sphingomonas TaxID=196159 RepID=UPI0010F9F0E2|nr:acyltransferase [Sphingomonas sp. 3P27F8]